MFEENEQKKAFEEKLENISEVKKQFETQNKVLKNEWENNIDFLEEIFNKPAILRDFLNIQKLQSLFFVNSQGEMLLQQLAFLESLFNKEELKKYLQENKLGNPPFVYDKRYKTTHNTIHHLYHLARYYKQCSEDIKNVNSVIEWGGGYGNMCKVFYNFSLNLKTYTIFDLPHMSAIQYAYLSSLYGDENVRICTDGIIKENKINLMNFNVFDKAQNFNGDLFLSNWALSESPIKCHNDVIDLNWFNCDKLLISFHQCGEHIPFMKESTNLGIKAKKAGAKIKDVKIIPGKNLYAFR